MNESTPVRNTDAEAGSTVPSPRESQASKGDRSSEALEAVAQASRLREAAIRLEDTAVAEARAQGASWQQIGDQLGISRAAAHSRYQPRLTYPEVGDLHGRWESVREIVDAQPLLEGLRNATAAASGANIDQQIQVHGSARVEAAQNRAATAAALERVYASSANFRNYLVHHSEEAAQGVIDNERAINLFQALNDTSGSVSRSFFEACVRAGLVGLDDSTLHEPKVSPEPGTDPSRGSENTASRFLKKLHADREVAGADDGHDMTLVLPDGSRVLVQVKTRVVPSPEAASANDRITALEEKLQRLLAEREASAEA